MIYVRVFGGWGHPWHHGSPFFVFLYLVSKSNFWAWCQEPSVLEVITWRTLMVPHQVLFLSGHPWHYRSSLCVIFNLCANFQLFSLIRSVSTTSNPQSPYFMYIDGCWLETWRMGSSLTPSHLDRPKWRSP